MNSVNVKQPEKIRVKVSYEEVEEEKTREKSLGRSIPLLPLQ